MLQYSNIAELFLDLVPEYKSRGYKNLVARFGWSDQVANRMDNISQKRGEKRLASYWIPGEVRQGRSSFRFGVAKEGHGYQGKRGDFCLVAASLQNKHLHVFYRRVELIGGLHYDTVIFREIERKMGPIKTVTIMAAEAFVFALKGNSNEKLYKLLKEYHEAT